MRTRKRDEAGGAIHFAVALRPSRRTVPESGHLREPRQQRRRKPSRLSRINNQLRKGAWLQRSFTLSTINRFSYSNTSSTCMRRRSNLAGLTDAGLSDGPACHAARSRNFQSSPATAGRRRINRKSGISAGLGCQATSLWKQCVPALPWTAGCRTSAKPEASLSYLFALRLFGDFLKLRAEHVHLTRRR